MEAVRPSTSSKKFLVYALIGIIAASALYITLFKSNNNAAINNNASLSNNNSASEDLIANSKKDAVGKFQKQFCGSDSKPNSTSYISEYKLPKGCEMPLGIAVDEKAGKIWYVSTKNGTLGSFNIEQNKFDKERLIPLWQSRGKPTDFSQVWDAKVDGKGDVWFTDEKDNSIWRYVKSSQTFEMYKVPVKSDAFGTTYPVSIDFDSNGNIYFVGIRSPTLWFGQITKMKNGTSNGISNIPLPVDRFKGIDPALVSTGSIAVDNRKNLVWISMLAFNTKGEILRYNIENKTFNTFDMPKELSSPVGLAVDNSGNLWVTDHGTSLFFKLDSNNGNITKFSTSKASPQIFGDSNNNTAPEGAYTLPYWIKKSNDGSLWFNEHTGNKIARFDPSNMTLIEYWIPTQDKLWGLCQSTNQSCGIANALQFSVGQNNNNDNSNNNQVWFSEWSENKISNLSGAEHLPISISTTPEEITIKKGESTEIKVNIKALSNDNNVNANMISSGSFTRNGALGNSNGIFSQQSLSIYSGNSKQVSYIFTPAADLKSGQYTLMLGADTGSVSILKAVRIKIL